MTDDALVRLAIKVSGLSSTKFARLVLNKGDRTVRRWKAGTAPLPREIRDKLLSVTAMWTLYPETRP